MIYHIHLLFISCCTVLKVGTFFLVTQEQIFLKYISPYYIFSTWQKLLKLFSIVCSGFVCKLSGLSRCQDLLLWQTTETWFWAHSFWHGGHSISLLPSLPSFRNSYFYKSQASKPAQLWETIILGDRSQCRVILPQFAQVTAVPQPPSAMVMAFCLLIYEGLLKSPKYQAGMAPSPTSYCTHDCR